MNKKCKRAHGDSIQFRTMRGDIYGDHMGLLTMQNYFTMALVNWASTEASYHAVKRGWSPLNITL